MNWKRYVAITATLTIGAYAIGFYSGQVRGIDKGKREERAAIVNYLEDVTSEIFSGSLRWGVTQKERKRIIALGDNMKQLTIEIQKEVKIPKITAFDLVSRTKGEYEE